MKNQMLSISKMTADAATNYYQKQGDEIYYQKNPEEIGIWKGELAYELGLITGIEIEPEQFKRLINQIHPHEDLVLVERPQEVAGYDFTFSAPKSVSIEIETNPDLSIRTELQNSHEMAVKRVRMLIENDYAGFQTREKDGTRGHKHTGKILSASFNHQTNRDHDPDTHTHLFISNMTCDEQGVWRSLDARELFKNEYYFGMVYRSELAKSLEEKGYNLRVSDRSQGFFELATTLDEQICESSSRAQAIEAERDRMRLELGRELTKDEFESAKTSTRQSKKKVDREEVRACNISKALKYGLKDLKTIQPMISQITATDALQIAANNLVESEAIFKKEELYRAALKVGLGSGITLNSISSAAQKNDNLITLSNSKLTTREMSEIESLILQNIKNTQSKMQAVLSKDKAVKSIQKISARRESENGFALNEGQIAVGIEILSNQDGLLVVQGDAGTGKTALLSVVNEIAKNQNRTIVGAAYTGSAAAEIEAASEIKSQTLHTLLLKKEELPQNSIVIVDEASMIGSRQLRELQKLAEKSNSKIVLIGDAKQFKGLSSGDMFTRLQGMFDLVKTVSMSESIRAKTSEMRELYQLIKERNFISTFAKMEKRDELKEASKEEAIQNIAANYDENTLVIASKNSDRIALNFAIRQKLGFSKGKIITITQNLTVSGIDRHFAQSYEIGNQINAEKPMPGLKPGSGGMIKGIDNAKNKITIETERGDKTIDLYKYGDYLSVTCQANHKLMVGEKVSFGKNDKKLGVTNGQTGIVQAIENSKLFVETGSKIIEINLKEYNYLDYGYAVTDIKSQGQTAQKVAILADAKMANSNAFYVQITRAQRSVIVFTDDLVKFKSNVEKTQHKTSTIDYLSSWKSKEKGHKNGRNIIKDLRSSIRNWSAKFDDLKTDFGNLISEARERWTTQFARYSHEYRQSAISDREHLINSEPKYVSRIFERENSADQSTGSRSLDNAIKSAREQSRGHGLILERSR